MPLFPLKGVIIPLGVLELKKQGDVSPNMASCETAPPCISNLQTFFFDFLIIPTLGRLLNEKLKMAKYFTVAEMLKSETAEKNQINNTPSVEVQQNIEELLVVLDSLREFYGPIKITSGYRCAELNKLVGGSPTSAHVIGYAADLRPVGDTFENFKAEVLKWLKKSRVKFDQCIIERSKSTQWVHFGLYNRKGQQRGQQFSLKA